jgi:hypothetical protein
LKLDILTGAAVKLQPNDKIILESFPPKPRISPLTAGVVGELSPAQLSGWPEADEKPIATMILTRSRGFCSSALFGDGEGDDE